ncbi:MAG: hypothetical protein WAM79_01140 [Candidatus Sulfotelmatobacter sp.]
MGSFSKTQIGIAVGTALVLVLAFVGYFWWLSNQGPVLSRSEDKDALTGLPISIQMNPLRDRSTEHAAAAFLREIRDGHCDEMLNQWEHDYHKKYARFICSSEAKHPLVSWQLADWQESPPFIILCFRGQRQNGPGQPGTYQDYFSVTTQKEGGKWVVTKYTPFS